MATARSVPYPSSRTVSLQWISYWLCIAFVFSVPWENAIHLGGFGRASKALGLAIVAVWSVSVLARGRFRQPGPFQKAYFLFLIWNGFTIFWSIDTDASMSGFRTYTLIFGMLLILWDLFDTEAAIEVAIQAYVLGAYITSISVIVNYMTAPPEKFPAHQRINALGYQTDGIALVVAIAAPAAWYLAMGPPSHRHSLLMRALNFAYIPLGLFALTLTGTRGATLASIPTAALMIWSLRGASASTRMMAAIAVAVAAILVSGFAPRGPLDRIGTATTVTEGGSGALGGRLSIWAQSREAIESRPVAGAGLDAHRAAVPVGKEAHNTYLSVLVETGIVGFILLASTMYCVFARVRHRTGWARRYWFAQLAVLAIGAMSLSLEDSKSIWIFLSLAYASATAAQLDRTRVLHAAGRARAARRLGLASPYASIARRR